MSNNYFNELVKRKKNYLFLRKHRNAVKGLSKSFKYAVGDILKVTYNIKIFYLVFEGICISLKNKNFLLAINPVNRPYSIVDDAWTYCDARKSKTVNVRRPIAPIARPNDIIHTERI